jgi:hypothetical protein
LKGEKKVIHHENIIKACFSNGYLLNIKGIPVYTNIYHKKDMKFIKGSQGLLNSSRPPQVTGKRREGQVTARRMAASSSSA